MEWPQAIVSFTIFIVFCLIGVPVWWQTTKVYRAGLPFNEISTLSKDGQLEIKAYWKVFLEEEIFKSSPQLVEPFEEMLQDEAKGNFQHYNVQVSFSNFKQTPKKELTEFDVSTTGVYHLSRLLQKVKENESHTKTTDYLHHRIYMVPAPKKVTDNKKKCQIIAGNSEIIVIVHETSLSYLQKCTKEISNNFKSTFYPQNILAMANKKDLMNETKFVQKRTNTESSSGIDISFTLANADPNDIIPQWEIKSAIRNYLSPLLKEIYFLGPFSITSQVLNFVDVGVLPKSSKDGYFYSKRKLPLLINPLETRLNEYTSNNPILNFVLYVPPLSQMPLFIKSSGQHYNSFTSPRWGGVIMKNIEKQNDINFDTKHIKFALDEEMKIFVHQFRKMIGLNRENNMDILFSAVDESMIAKWEVDYLLVESTISNLGKSVSTLTSLAELLEKIANIVIRDDIKDLIEEAVIKISKAKELLAKGDHKSAFFASKAALINSEKAFYDHSLLALLYFPDDQKYAIYLPLFLPICIPVTLSFVGAIKFMKQ